MINNTKKKFRLSPPQVLALGFIQMILAGAVLLSLPVSLSEEGQMRHQSKISTIGRKMIK